MRCYASDNKDKEREVQGGWGPRRGRQQLTHVVSLVAIIVTVIDHKVTGDCRRHVRGDKLEITIYNKEIWVEPAISLLPSWPDPDCPGPEGRSHNTNWRLQITISIYRDYNMDRANYNRQIVIWN